MPFKEEKRRRSGLVEEIAQSEKAMAIKFMPISFSDLGALFDHLDLKLGSDACIHTSQISQAFLQDKGLEPEKVIPWLQEYGGYCDCEVLANVEDIWRDDIDKNT